MGFFPASASANRIGAALALGLAAASLRAEGADFIVEPSTVVAGRTAAVFCSHPLERAVVIWKGRRVPFYPIGGSRWRALIGVSPLEPAGTRTVVIEGVWRGGGPFLAEAPFAVEDGTYPVSRVKLAPERDALFTAGAVDRDSMILAALCNQAPSPRKLWNGAFLWPSTGVVSSPFGARRTYGDRPASSPHTGMDIAAPAGTPVNAPQRGRVAYAGRLDSFGSVALLDHGQGVYSYCLHMQSLDVHAGQRVRAGRRLGLMGQEGVATGPHVHWSLAVSGERVDPQDWVDRKVPW